MPTPPPLPPNATPYPARIVGKVQYRIGDGALETAPVGQPVTVVNAIASMVLTWTDPATEQSITVALAKNEFEFYCETGAIELETAQAA